MYLNGYIPVETPSGMARLGVDWQGGDRHCAAWTGNARQGKLNERNS